MAVRCSSELLIDDCKPTSKTPSTLAQPSPSHRSQLAANLPFRYHRRLQIERRRRHRSLQLVQNICRLRKAPGESHIIPTTSTRHPSRPAPRPSLSTTTHLSDSLVNNQYSHSSSDLRHPSILQLHPARPSPPVTLLHSILQMEDTPQQPSLQHHLRRRAIRIYMGTRSSKADLFHSRFQ
jgi:hypothetical protein